MKTALAVALGFVLFAVIVLGAMSFRKELRANARRAALEGTVNKVEPTTAKSYVLEVISLGVTLDRYRQGALWDALTKGRSSIREQDPKKYPWTNQDKFGEEGGQSLSSAENGGFPTLEYWGAPTVNANSSVFNNLENPPSETHPIGGILGGNETNGMPFHMFVLGPFGVAERPDRLIERAFELFDKYPDLPYLLLSASDGLYFRDLYRPKDSPPLIEDGYYVPSMPGSSALLVLARRERVDPLRPFAWDDPDYKFRQKTLRNAYYDLTDSFVPPNRKGMGRQPTIAEWLKFTAEFARRDDVYPRGIASVMDDVNPFSHLPPRDFKPTPWFPVPWTKDQIETFDRLPTLGFLHRPVFVRTVDAEGRPLARRDQRLAALKAGWQQALETLPESQRQSAPVRVAFSTGGNVEQTIALRGVVDAFVAAGAPEIDAAQPARWIDTDARLGNTGAATWFMQMAIGVMGSYREGGVSAAVNLRDPAEASIVLISPPPERLRLGQYHPEGGDVFGNRTTPAVDPADYKQ